MSVYQLVSKDIVKSWDSEDFEEDYKPYITLKNWSNLLDYAVEGDESAVKAVMANADGKQVNEALQVLESATSKATEYTPPKEEEYGFHNGELVRYWGSTIKPQDLNKARTMVINQLLPRHFQNNNLTSLSKKDKRAIEKNIFDKIESLQSKEGISEFLQEYKPILEHKRNPRFDWIRSTIFGSSQESKLKENVLKKLEEKEQSFNSEVPTPPGEGVALQN